MIKFTQNNFKYKIMAFIIILFVLGLLLVFLSFVTVQQGTVAVITVFGKYKRILTPGLSMKIPFIEKVYKKISIQNRSVELAFRR